MRKFDERYPAGKLLPDNQLGLTPSPESKHSVPCSAFVLRYPLNNFFDLSIMSFTPNVPIVQVAGLEDAQQACHAEFPEVAAALVLTSEANTLKSDN